MSEKGWGGVNLPKELIKRIRRVIPWVGFTSVAEYVREAVRIQLRKHEIYVEIKEDQLERGKEE